MSDHTMARSLRVRKVHSLRTCLWLARGWRDFLASPMVGLCHGLLMGAFGGLMLWQAWDRFWVLAGAIYNPARVCALAATGHAVVH